MEQVALISDTHVPSRADAIPAWVRRRVGGADHVVHAGDFDSSAAYATVLELADGALTAVRGNTDPGSVDLPLVDALTVEGVTFVVTHGHGNRAQYEARVASIVQEHADGAEPVVGVSGHTHEVLDETVDGVHLLNPGSATGAMPAPQPTMMTVAVEDGDYEVTTHED